MSIKTLFNAKSDFAKIYSIEYKDYKLIDKKFNKLYEEEKMS